MQLKQQFHIRVLIVIAILVKSSSYYVPKAVGAVSTLSQSTADKILPYYYCMLWISSNPFSISRVPHCVQG